MTARDLLSLLAERHKDDVFVPECKTGASWTGEHIRLDAWAMRRSWARACVWGYEIKVGAVENRIERLKRLVPSHTIEELRRLARDSRALADDLERAAKGEAL